ncbi:hypothetical protein LOC54_10060 [Acetobacter sp. AN02]|uniref:lysozyme inhibitor LprI family protein n=1 Tax=Acetobacter sp. AN02 TaxID=2894186 RepID=UPI0024344C03|nr:hypothetical protein [Acetobacter sp. AN02]MDG6095440.1 hypothetical protein [Acetobacter sp. AN02]
MSARSLYILLPALLILAGIWPQILSAEEPGPGFSCSAAKTVTEKAICADKELSSADREMNTLYALAGVSALGYGRSNELEAQRRTLKWLSDCATVRSGSLTECLRLTYNSRNTELAAAVLLRAPDEALTVLRRTDPGYAALMEALQMWASEPPDANWTAPERSTKKRGLLLF